MKVGLEVLLDEECSLLKGKRVGVIVNQASIDHHLHYTPALLLDKGIDVRCIFSGEHGPFGDLQDQVGFSDTEDHISSLPVFSLYGKRKLPSKEMCEGIDCFVFDLQDVGTRVYTYIYTMAYCMMAAARYKKVFVVLDRPNPINGLDVEGNVLEEEFSSFVGLYPIPMRHGMTIGELACLFNEEFGIGCSLEVIRMSGWKREMWFDDTNLPWVSPSPNMATLDTATVYPGTVLIEGTNLSEGRGTTHPFELVGAPWIDPVKLEDRLNKEEISGVRFRPLFFTPTFGKWEGERCGGIQVHLLDRTPFRPFRTGLFIIRAILQLWPERFEFSSPPYEYERKRLPFDMITGTSSIRKALMEGNSIDDMERSWERRLHDFLKVRERYLLY